MRDQDLTKRLADFPEPARMVFCGPQPFNELSPTDQTTIINALLGAVHTAAIIDEEDRANIPYERRRFKWLGYNTPPK